MFCSALDTTLPPPPQKQKTKQNKTKNKTKQNKKQNKTKQNKQKKTLEASHFQLRAM